MSKRGKHISSLNAIRHGILSGTVVLENESSDRFVEHLVALQESFQPAGPVEIALVENMAVCRWRQMRVWALEKAGLTFEIRKQAPQSEEMAAEDPATQTALAFHTLCDRSRSFEVLGRYESRYDRQYNRALQRLNELRERRKIALFA